MSLCTVGQRLVAAGHQQRCAPVVLVACKRALNTDRDHQHHKQHHNPNTRSAAQLALAVGGGLVAAACALRYYRSADHPLLVVHAFTPKKWKDDTEKAVKLTSRERRFIKFASAEYDGQLYMTPQDFLDSVVEQDARRMSCIVLLSQSKYQYHTTLSPTCSAFETQNAHRSGGAANRWRHAGTEEGLRADVPDAARQGHHLVHRVPVSVVHSDQCVQRRLFQNGETAYYYIPFNTFRFTYTEPKSGFEIAFNMFDTDGNQRVDKNEFLVVS